ncbi:hypothetical protein BCR42DRAFT_226651 [Absidia repens]|uniref:Uncharacterized protein n=1 Tax=Absidia repens TaxID=90262 RepID=A0A1X2HBD1_9FUNG|nr:hypothetical protein BCR42DRAFT_226651 [Absidia repens]
MKLIMSQLMTMNSTIVKLQEQLNDRDNIIEQLQQSLATLMTSTQSPTPTPQPLAPQPPQPNTDPSNPWSNKTQVHHLRQQLSSPSLSQDHQKTQAVA